MHGYKLTNGLWLQAHRCRGGKPQVAGSEQEEEEGEASAQAHVDEWLPVIQ